MLIKNYYILFHIYFLINILSITINAIDYCNIKCIDAQKNDSIFHIKCLRPDCRLNGPCKNSPKNWIGLKEEEKVSILDLHNDLRNSLALGKIKNLPSASNMYKLQWDNEVADIAQCWANACVMTHDYGCRDIDGYKVGQNMGMEAPYIEDVSIESLITYWFKEGNNYSWTDLYDGGEKTSGHFTQIAWANTKYLGCGKVVYHDDKYKLDTINLICNYMPEGNVFGESVYKKGAPASACPAKSGKDDVLIGLCAQKHRRASSDPHAAIRLKSVEHSNGTKIKFRSATSGAEYSKTRINGFMVALLCLRILYL